MTSFFDIITNNYSKATMYSSLGFNSLLLLLASCSKGKTRAQLDELLNIEDPFSELELLQKLTTGIININCIFINSDTPINPLFYNKIKSCAYIKAGSSDTVTLCQEINKYVSTKTNNLINNIIDLDPTGTLHLCIMNIIYFKRDWATPFKKSNTKKLPFTCLDNTIINTHFMKGLFNVKYYEDNQVQVVEKPYKDGFSFVIILPKIGVSLSTVANKTYNTKQEWGVEILMPKFTHKIKLDLTDLMQKINITAPFINSFDFSNIIPIELKITSLAQDIVIIVNEKGTKAAAVTSGLAASSSKISPCINANRPFIYHIMDKNKIKYFSGIYNGKKID